MASKPDCPFCAVMKPIFEEVVRELSGIEGIGFGVYNVEDDDWALADELGLEGVPGFAIIEEETKKVFEVNNEGLVEKEVLISMVVNNLSKK